MRTRFLTGLLVAGVTTLPGAFVPPAAHAASQPLQIEDLAALRTASQPQVSPDGKWVAYLLEEVDRDGDRRITRLWMTDWAGQPPLQLTGGDTQVSRPRWSPDGQRLAFLAHRADEVVGTQVWTLDLRGGEARPLTRVKGDLSDYAWSPDGKRLALVVRPPSTTTADTPPAEGNAKPQAKPVIVIDGYRFKQDGVGYVSHREPARIFLYDIERDTLDALTGHGAFPESSPAWSPDGRSLAFSSNRRADWERSVDSDIYVADARAGASPRKLTDFPGQDGGPIGWSADGRFISYMQGVEARHSTYGRSWLAVVASDGSAPPQVPGQDIDRGFQGEAFFSADGRSIDALVADDQQVHPVRFSLRDGTPEPLLPGSVVNGWSRAAGRTAVALTTDDAPPEIHALENGKLRRLTRHNDGWLAQRRLAAVEDIRFDSPDGATIHGMLIKPPGYVAGRRYPTLIRLHGGPHGQDTHGFHFERQLLAANGYVVVTVNYRGSSGRGTPFAHAHLKAWGDKDVVDVLAAADHVVALGIADPERLGIGGWSYGGILTNYVIASDTRFKAAISGAGTSNIPGLYGTDHYIHAHDNVWGPPWRDTELVMRLSYPLFKADRIRTPTMFVTGEKDVNVPAAGSEQMYQALKSLQVDSRLIVYPDQYHGITRPSYQKDLYQRYLDWYGQYLGTP